MTATDPPRRYKAFEETHTHLIETAVQLLSEKGAEGLSLSALARAAAVNRTTVYYHFKDRDALIAAVKLWSSQQIISAFRTDLPQAERIDFVARFVLEQPEVMKLWIEEFIAPGDIRDSYPHWDALVAGIERSFAEGFPGEPIDAEVFCVDLLASALIGPRVFKNRVRPDESNDRIIARFRAERQRVLRRDTLGVASST